MNKIQSSSLFKNPYFITAGVISTASLVTGIVLNALSGGSISLVLATTGGAGIAGCGVYGIHSRCKNSAPLAPPRPPTDEQRLAIAIYEDLTRIKTFFERIDPIHISQFLECENCEFMRKEFLRRNMDFALDVRLKAPPDFLVKQFTLFKTFFEKHDTSFRQLINDCQRLKNSDDNPESWSRVKDALVKAAKQTVKSCKQKIIQEESIQIPWDVVLREWISTHA